MAAGTKGFCVSDEYVLIKEGSVQILTSWHHKWPSTVSNKNTGIHGTE